MRFQAKQITSYLHTLYMRLVNKIIWNRWLAIRRTGTNLPYRLENFNKRTIKKILVISCTALGDTLLSTPAIHATRKLFPNAHITWLVKRPYATFFSSNPHINEIIPYPGAYKKNFKLVREFKKRNFSLCLSFHDSDPCPVQAAWLAGVPFILRSGAKDEKLAHFLSARTPYRDEVHAIEQRLDVLRMINADNIESIPDKTRMILPVNATENERFWKQLSKTYHLDLTSKLNIGFQISASRIYRMWPAENFAALAKKIIGSLPCSNIFLLGGPSDYQLGDNIVKMAHAGHQLINLAGKIHIADLPLAIKGLDLLITNDTGPLHMAVALKTPTIGLFVPSVARHTGPYQDLDIHTVINKKRPCNPCVRKYCKDPHCMELITVEEVYNAARSYLERYCTTSQNA